MINKNNIWITVAVLIATSVSSGCDMDWTTINEDDTAYETYV